MSNKYTIGTDKKSIFADAEPYHYGDGDGYPDAGFYLPNIGEDDNPNTTDVKIQNPVAETNNGYSNILSLPEFKIKSSPISYIEKGTFPLLDLIGECSNKPLFQLKASYDNTGVLSELKLYTKDEDVDIQSDSNLTDMDYFCTCTKSYLAHSSTHESIKRIGFILAGGGGGGGGTSCLDANKNGKSSDVYATPGGGGGGGEIIYGVLDVSYPQWAVPADTSPSAVTLEYLMHFGKGGDGGKSGVIDGNLSWSSPSYGEDGKAGKSSQLWIKINNGSYIKIGEARGGLGATAGQQTTGGSGGAGGGTTSTITSPLSISYGGTSRTVGWLCGRCQGGLGGTPDGDIMKNTALDCTVYFSNLAPSSDDTRYCKIFKHAIIERSKSNASVYVAEYRFGPGGHSIGVGGGGEYIYANEGAGGAGGYSTGNGFSDGSETISTGKGGDGCGGFYY